MDKLENIFKYQQMFDTELAERRGLTDIPMEVWIQRETLAMLSELAELIDEVASYKDAPSATGYSVYYYVHNMYSNANIRLLEVGGVIPENASIASGDYPFTQDFYAVIRADAPEDSIQRKLYDWLTTEEGQALITGAGYVAVAGEEIQK